MKKIKILQKKRGLISMQNKTLRDSSVGMIKFVRVLYSAIAIIFLFIAFLFIAISENPVGIIFMLLAVVFFRVANQCKKILKEKNQAEVAPQRHRTSPSLSFELANGSISSSNTHNVNIVGVMREHDNIDPQTIIPTLNEMDEIVLEWDRKNKYDSTAIKVKTLSGIQIGWIAKNDNIKPLLINAFKNGDDIIAWVSETYELPSYPGNVGLCIEITILEKTTKKL